MTLKTNNNTINTDNDWFVLEMTNYELKLLVQNLQSMLNHNTHLEKRRYAVFPEKMSDEEKEKIFEQSR